MAAAPRYKELHHRQLRAFAMVARYKSFSAAARALNVSQPVVWEQVRALERDFGGSLLQRHGRQLELADDGRLLYELGSSILAATDSLHQTFEDRRTELPRTLVLAGSPTIFALEMAQAVVDFCRQQPQIQLSVLTYPDPEIEDLVATGKADAGVLPDHPALACHPLLVWQVLCVRRWRLVMPAHHPLQEKRRVTAADLVRYPLILPQPENDWREEVNAVLDRAGVLGRLRIALQINNTMAACRYVSLGLGLTVTAFWHKAVEFPNLCSRPLDHLFPDERLVVVWRRGATLRPQAQLFIDFARRHLCQE